MKPEPGQKEPNQRQQTHLHDKAEIVDSHRGAALSSHEHAGLGRNLGLGG